MAARGAESKDIIFKKIMETFSGSFWEDEGKILRIPMDENGNRIEIKVALTAAKSNLKDAAAGSAFETTSSIQTSAPAQKELEVTPEEKANIAKLLESLNL